MVKKNFKKAGYGIFGLLGLWLAGTFWAVTWVDKQALIDFPGKSELNVARLFWSTSPAIDQTQDADRALKFSWLRASTEINRKEKKEISKIVDVLAEEFLFTAKYFERHGQALPPKLRIKFATQLLTYLNRVNLYQKYFHENVENIFRDLSGSGVVGDADDSEKENWYREMMIRSHLRQDGDSYKAYKEKLDALLKKEATSVSSAYVDGVIAFYDGVLSCISKDTSAAVIPLDVARANLATYPKITTEFFYGDLNVLLVGKGMEGSPRCNDLLGKVLLSGA